MKLLFSTSVLQKKNHLRTSDLFSPELNMSEKTFVLTLPLHLHISPRAVDFSTFVEGKILCTVHFSWSLKLIFLFLFGEKGEMVKRGGGICYISWLRAPTSRLGGLAFTLTIHTSYEVPSIVIKFHNRTIT